MDFAGPKEVMELFFSCRKLKNLDYGSTSDPVVHILTLHGSSWVKIGETDTKQNTLNPDFAKSLIVDFFFEKVQPMRFDVYDKDPSKLEFIGRAETPLGKIAGARNQTLILPLNS